MSRYCGNDSPQPILSAAAHWRDVALLGGGSVFSGKALWTEGNLAELDKYFVRNLDEGEGRFIEKLQSQLSLASPATKQLTAEMMWLLYLCPSSLTERHKRQVVQRVWSWSQEPLPDSKWLADDVLAGVGSAGPGFNQNQWRELVYLTNLTAALQRLSIDERKALLADGWVFAEWLTEVEDGRNRQLRHMLLFLLFPDDFERIFGGTDRLKIAESFSGVNSRELRRMNPTALDRLLLATRRKLETEYGTSELDYYISPLSERWNSDTFGEATESITASHVMSAIAEIDEKGVPAGSESTGYDLIWSGNRYPPKLVLSLAARHANGIELDRGTFTGGDESPAFRVLRNRGFDIEPKVAITELVSKFIAQAKAGTDLGTQHFLKQYRGLDVSVSFGRGNVARIPWVAFLAEGQRVSDGIYPVLLFYRDRNVLLLCYGVSETNRPEGSWKDIGSRDTVQTWFEKRFNAHPDRYGDSFVRKEFEAASDPPNEELTRELDLLIDEYKRVLDTRATGLAQDEVAADILPTLEIRTDLAAACKEFAEALKQSFVYFGRAHDDLVRTFVASVVTKPLVILTGLSGSGKTQIALRFGEWLGPGRLHVAPVRPDWTGAEALFGYEDGLKPVVGGRSAWSVPAPLEFVFRATRDPSHPYLLLLDEMNLAHVERYFADVLSGMESGQKCLPNLVRESDGLWRVKPDGDSRIEVPRNLWIVGTVNVDETTYMFSPKVLDRANTFEFRVDAEDLQLEVRKSRKCSPGDSALVRGLLSIAKNDEWERDNPSPHRAAIAYKLKEVHRVLARHAMEFGHRMFYESLRFGAISAAAGTHEMEPVLDRIVMQKVLPRLHGSRRRLEVPLLALAHFCRDLPEQIGSDEKLPGMGLEEGADTTAKLPTSYGKVCRMLRNLRSNQFASFTE